MKRVAYTYTIIRYVHDLVSGESLNVAVALMDSDGRFEFKIPTSFVRIKRAFPDANLAGLRHSLVALEQLARAFLRSAPGSGLEQVLNHVMRDDEASFRTSEVGAGVAPSVAEAADSVLERFITRCDFEFEEIETLKKRTEQWKPPTKIVVHLAANDDWADTKARRFAR